MSAMVKTSQRTRGKERGMNEITMRPPCSLFNSPWADLRCEKGCRCRYYRQQVPLRVLPLEQLPGEQLPREQLPLELPLEHPLPAAVACVLVDGRHLFSLVACANKSCSGTRSLHPCHASRGAPLTFFSRRAQLRPVRLAPPILRRSSLATSSQLPAGPAPPPQAPCRRSFVWSRAGSRLRVWRHGRIEVFLAT
jgi:hypothetical protein